MVEKPEFSPGQLVRLSASKLKAVDVDPDDGVEFPIAPDFLDHFMVMADSPPGLVCGMDKDPGAPDDRYMILFGDVLVSASGRCLESFSYV